MSLCPFFQDRVVLLVASSSSAGSNGLHRLMYYRNKLLLMIQCGLKRAPLTYLFLQ
jgi:hypothetical protein